MKKKEITAVLREAQQDGEMACVRAAAKGTTYTGFVVGLSDEFVLLHVYDSYLVCLDGYCVFPLREVRKARPWDERRSFAYRALRVKGIRAAAPNGVVLDEGMPALLASVDAHFPLTMLKLDHQHPDRCFVGRVAKLGSKSVTLRQISPGARWRRTREFRYDDITRVDFADGYAEALWLVSEEDRRRTGRGIENDTK
jgi:hypothetical protein